MDTDTKLELVAAIDVLIRSPNAHALFDAMLQVAPVVARHKTIRMAGEGEPLNILARYKTSHPEVYGVCMDLIEQKRSARGFDPLVITKEDKFDKVEYMRGFMAEKRSRARRAADIENQSREPRDRLIGKSRLDFMTRQSAKWKIERDELEAKARQASPTGRLSRDVLSQISEQFWAKIDARLDALEDDARNRMLNPRRLSATSLADLDAALQLDPYDLPKGKVLN